MTHAESFYDGACRCGTPASIRTARYRVRVVYAGDVFSSPPSSGWSPTTPLEVHPWMTKEGQPKPVEFDVPVGGDGRRRADADVRQEPGAAARAAAIRSPKCG